MSITQAIIASIGSGSPRITGAGYFNMYMDENQTNTGYVSYENQPGQWIYWSLWNGSTTDSDWADGTLPSGSFYITGSGTYYFNWTTADDLTTEGQEHYGLIIGTYPGGQDIGNWYWLYVNDTSQSPPTIYKDFTIEWWQKMDVGGQPPYPRLFDVGGHPSENPGISFEGSYIYVWGGGTSDSISSSYANRGVWTHWAIERHNGTIKLYRDGTNMLSSNNVGAVPLNNITDPLTIGYGSDQAWLGKVTDFHWLKGVAKYRGNFTRPSSPVTAQTGSMLLLPVASDGTKFDDTVGLKVPTINGTVTYSTDSPFVYSAQFTALSYGGQNVQASPWPQNLRAGLKVSNQHGFTSYILDPDLVPNTVMKLVDSPVALPNEIFDITEETNPITLYFNMYSGINQISANIYSNPAQSPALAVVAGWTWTCDDGASGVVVGRTLTAAGGQPTNTYITIDTGRTSGNAVGTYTFTPPATATNGSLVFNGTGGLSYAASVDWALDVDAIVTDGLTLNLDANDPNSYSISSSNTWTNLGGGGVGDITLYGSPTYTSGPPSYLEFNGTTSQYGVGSTPNIINNSQYTKLIWFNVNSTSADNNLISSNNGGHYVFMRSTNHIYCGHGAWGDTNINPSTGTISAGTWYMIAVTFDTTNGMSLYINGVLDHTYNAQLTGPSGDGSVNVGCYAPAGNTLNGKISRAMCYNRALTAQEVLDNFNATRTRYGV